MPPEGVSAQAQANRGTLRDAMAAGGLTVYSGEWWRTSTALGAGVDRPILDVPVTERPPSEVLIVDRIAP